MMKKQMITIGILILLIGLLAGCIESTDCTDGVDLVSNDITGTLSKVVLIGDEVKLTFSGDSYGIITAMNIDSDGTNWYNVLKSHEGERIKLTWIANYDKLIIGYVEYLER